MSSTWECCCCTTGPQVFAISPACANCGHHRCVSCKVNKKIPPPVRPKRAPMDQYLPNCGSGYPLNYKADAAHGSFTEDLGRSSNPRPQGGLSKKSLRLRARVDLTGWWKCHWCRYTNNPAVCPEKCSNCPHIKCNGCTQVSHQQA